MQFVLISFTALFAYGFGAVLMQTGQVQLKLDDNRIASPLPDVSDPGLMVVHGMHCLERLVIKKSENENENITKMHQEHCQGIMSQILHLLESDSSYKVNDWICATLREVNVVSDNKMIHGIDSDKAKLLQIANSITKPKQNVNVSKFNTEPKENALNVRPYDNYQAIVNAAKVRPYNNYQAMDAAKVRSFDNYQQVQDAAKVRPYDNYQAVVNAAKVRPYDNYQQIVDAAKVRSFDNYQQVQDAAKVRPYDNYQAVVDAARVRPYDNYQPMDAAKVRPYDNYQAMDFAKVRPYDNYRLKEDAANVDKFNYNNYQRLMWNNFGELLMKNWTDPTTLSTSERTYLQQFHRKSAMAMGAVSVYCGVNGNLETIRKLLNNE